MPDANTQRNWLANILRGGATGRGSPYQNEASSPFSTSPRVYGGATAGAAPSPRATPTNRQEAAGNRGAGAKGGGGGGARKAGGGRKAAVAPNVATSPSSLLESPELNATSPSSLMGDLPNTPVVPNIPAPAAEARAAHPAYPGGTPFPGDPYGSMATPMTPIPSPVPQYPYQGNPDPMAGFQPNVPIARRGALPQNAIGSYNPLALNPNDPQRMPFIPNALG